MAPRISKRAQLEEWTRPGSDGRSPARLWRMAAGQSPEQAALAVKVSARSVARYEMGLLPRDELRIDSYYAYLKKIQPKEEQ